MSLVDLYKDLHMHPELAFAEHRTSAIIARYLATSGYDVTTGMGSTGVVGMLRNGVGPTVALRADMDALPVAETTGLPYASTQTARDPNGDTVPVMHACGHDMHVACLLGAAAELADRRSEWSGTLMLVFQPAEEVGRGAQAMIDDGLFTRFGRPNVVLGQHVAPIPAGVIGLRSGPAFAASDLLRITVHGRGGHGSRPEVSVDPVVLAAAIVMRLQTVVSREMAATDAAVVTVGSLHAGSAANVIADKAELLVSVRSFTREIRDRALHAITRIVEAEAVASAAPLPPEIEPLASFPTLVNDPAAVNRTRPVLQSLPAIVVDPGPVTGSEDVGLLARACDAPCVYWLLGGADPALFSDASDVAAVAAKVAELPSNHSPLFAPVIEPTLTNGIAALVTAAIAWFEPAPAPEPIG